MKARKIILGLIIALIFLAILINIRPNITGFAVEENLAITDITVTAKEPVEAEFSIEQSKDNIEKIDKPVYYYLKIKDADFKDMNSFLIKFRVEKEWIRRNGLKNEDIKLYYLKGNWNRAETKFTNEDENYVYYETKTDVSDLFAIVVDKIKQVIEEKEEAEDKDIIFFAVLPLMFIGLTGLLGVLFFIWIYKKIRYWRITRIIRAICYYTSLYVVSNVVILFGFSFLKIEGSASNNEVVWYGLIPVLASAIILVFVLHCLIKLYQHISLIRGFVWFVFDYGFITLILAMIFYALPAKEVTLGRVDILVYGILPLVIISFIVLGLYRLATRWVYKVWW